MDCELVSDSQSDKLDGGSRETSPIITYESKFNELFPIYLSFGMTEEQYWDRDSELVIYYRKANELKQDRRNQEMWLQGRYIYEALGAISPLLHAFAKNGTKAQPYLSEPYSLSKAQDERKEEQHAKKVFDKGKRLMEQLMAKNKSEK